ncbi:MAG: hypothetical protein J0M18_11775 [Ignavibacteria bacterium]|nr:hypothetical protein [Ignavibacteria bacterium]
MKYIIAILFAIGSFISIVHWLNHFSLSPDSTNYITASENFVKHGSLFVYSNWPSKSFEPKIEPYTEYMPGLPIFTSVLFLFTDNPDTVMLVMNSLCIVLVYFIVLMILYELKLNDFLKIIFLLFLTFFEPFRFIFSHFWTETLFIIWSLLAVYFALKLIKEDNKKYLILGCIAVSFSAFIKMYGVFNCAFFLIPFVLHRKSFAKLALFIFASSILVLIWYLRNEIIYGYFTSSHKIFQQFNSSNLLRPFKWTLFLLGNNNLANVWAILLLVVGLSPLWFYYRKKLNSNLDFKIWGLFLIGAVVNFTGIYFLSLVSSFDYLESRLLAPVYILCFLVFFMSIKILYEVVHPTVMQVKYLILALPVILFAVNPAFEKEIDTNIDIHYAWEHELWNEINQKGIVVNSSHYITEFNYIHQIYGNKPQRIIPDDSVFLNIGFLAEILNKGKAPFVVLRNNELPYFHFDKIHNILGYKRAELENKHFTVYVKNNN